MRIYRCEADVVAAVADRKDSVEHTAKEAAISLFLAMTQGVDWSDVIRAAFGSVPRASHKGEWFESSSYLS